MWKSLLQGYEKVEDIITCVAMVCGVGIMFVGVVSRYVFNHPLRMEHSNRIFRRHEER